LEYGNQLQAVKMFYN